MPWRKKKNKKCKRCLCRVIRLWDLEEERKVLTSICKSPKYKVSRKSTEWDLTSCMRADGQIENRETRGKEESLLAIIL